MIAAGRSGYHLGDLHKGDIAPCDHMVQFYEEDRLLSDTLQSYIGGGLGGGESVIVIATRDHLEAVEDRLRHAGVSLNIARARYRYITMDAEELLERFMVRGWPNEELFTQLAGDLLRRARMGSPRVRAFGEMVSVLWSRGLNGATLRLEQIWHELCREEGFALLCAYPRQIFNENADESMRDICATHSRVISSLAA
jgi:hypothetical protein